MDSNFPDRRVAEGPRVAIVGAGPAGCLLAIALLDAANVRRKPVQVFLFHGGGDDDGSPLLIDPAAVARLAAAGVSLPAESTVPLAGVRAIAGRGDAHAAHPLFAARSGGRGDLLQLLRTEALRRGAQLLERPVDDVRPAGDGGWTVRAAGASMRAEAVVLACGAGAPLASRLPDHQPPPLWRCCAARLELRPGEGALGPWATRVHGERRLPDLQILAAEGDETVLAIGEDVGPSELAEGLLSAVAAGKLPPVRLRQPRRVFLPAGAARPGLPALGDALGGPPGPWRLARIADQAQALAAAWFEGGPEAMLACARNEALHVEREVGRELRRQRRWKERRAAVIEAALRREEGSAPGWQPVHRALAATAGPPDGEGGLLLTLRVLVALVLAWILVAFAGLRGSGAAPEPPAPVVFVVDDDEDQAALLCDYLESRGVVCAAFGDGMSAVAAAARTPPAVVILDVALPWLGGPTVCRVLQERRQVPVFLTTALPLPLARAEAQASGATAILSKPLDLAGLAMRLQPWVPVGPPQEPALRAEGGARPWREPADAAQPPA